MSKKVIIIGPPKEAKETLEVLIDNKIEAEIYTEYPKSILSSLKELDLELDDMIKEIKYEKLATIAEPFHPKPKHSPKGHQRKYKFHK